MPNKKKSKSSIKHEEILEHLERLKQKVSKLEELSSRLKYTLEDIRFQKRR